MGTKELVHKSYRLDRGLDREMVWYIYSFMYDINGNMSSYFHLISDDEGEMMHSPVDQCVSSW